MAVSLSVTGCLNLSQVRPSLLRRVMGPLSGGLVGGGLDGLASVGVFIVDDCLAIAGGTEGLVSTTIGLYGPCLRFLLPRRLGSLLVSRVLDNVFLFFESVRRGWVWSLPQLGQILHLLNFSPCSLSSLPFLH